MLRVLCIAAAISIAAATGAIAQPAVRTNLLADAAMAPNVGFIYPLSPKISIEADLAWAHWRIDNLFALQYAQGSVAAKYWFPPRRDRLRLQGRPLTGWSAGVYALYCGRFDVRWRDGWQGSGFWSLGVTGGYSTPISPRLSLEFLLGAGYLRAREARHYHRPERGHLMWQETVRHAPRASITRAQVNLVWSICKPEGTPR